MKKKQKICRLIKTIKLTMLLDKQMINKLQKYIQQTKVKRVNLHLQIHNNLVLILQHKKLIKINLVKERKNLILHLNLFLILIEIYIVAILIIQMEIPKCLFLFNLFNYNNNKFMQVQLRHSRIKIIIKKRYRTQKSYF